MQLLFRCPITGDEFRTEQWSIRGSMQVIQRDGRATLEGSVTVECPLCGALHSFIPDELSCPLAARPDEEE